MCSPVGLNITTILFCPLQDILFFCFKLLLKRRLSTWPQHGGPLQIMKKSKNIFKVMRNLPFPMTSHTTSPMTRKLYLKSVVYARKHSLGLQMLFFASTFLNVFSGTTQQRTAEWNVRRPGIKTESKKQHPRAK